MRIGSLPLSPCRSAAAKAIALSPGSWLALFHLSGALGLPRLCGVELAAAPPAGSTVAFFVFLNPPLTLISKLLLSLALPSYFLWHLNRLELLSSASRSPGSPSPSGPARAGAAWLGVRAMRPRRATPALDPSAAEIRAAGTAAADWVAACKGCARCRSTRHHRRRAAQAFRRAVAAVRPAVPSSGRFRDEIVPGQPGTTDTRDSSATSRRQGPPVAASPICWLRP